MINTLNNSNNNINLKIFVQSFSCDGEYYRSHGIFFSRVGFLFLENFYSAIQERLHRIDIIYNNPPPNLTHHYKNIITLN